MGTCGVGMMFPSRELQQDLEKSRITRRRQRRRFLFGSSEETEPDPGKDPWNEFRKRRLQGQQRDPDATLKMEETTITPEWVIENVRHKKDSFLEILDKSGLVKNVCPSKEPSSSTKTPSSSITTTSSPPTTNPSTIDLITRQESSSNQVGVLTNRKTHELDETKESSEVQRLPSSAELQLPQEEPRCPLNDHHPAVAITTSTKSTPTDQQKPLLSPQDNGTSNGDDIDSIPQKTRKSKSVFGFSVPWRRRTNHREPSPAPTPSTKSKKTPRTATKDDVVPGEVSLSQPSNKDDAPVSPDHIDSTDSSIRMRPHQPQNDEFIRYILRGSDGSGLRPFQPQNEDFINYIIKEDSDAIDTPMDAVMDTPMDDEMDTPMFHAIDTLGLEQHFREIPIDIVTHPRLIDPEEEEIIPQPAECDLLEPDESGDDEDEIKPARKTVWGRLRSSFRKMKSKKKGKM